MPPSKQLFDWLMIDALLVGLVLAVCCECSWADAGTTTTAPRIIQTSFLSGGKEISAERWEPGRGEKYPAVLLLHGLDGLEKTGHIYRAAADRMARKGYVVLLVHYFDRTGTDTAAATTLLPAFQRYLTGRPGSRPEQAQLRGLFADWQETVTDAVAHARALPQVRQDQVGLVGFSLGAFLALAVAADEETRVTAVVDFFGGMPPGVQPRYLPPTLILHGDHDQVVPVTCAHQLQEWFRSRRLSAEAVIYSGVDHVFMQGDGRLQWLAAWDAEGRTERFLRSHLQNRSPSRVGGRAEFAAK